MTGPIARTLTRMVVFVGGAMLCLAPGAGAQTLAGSDLVNALKKGGYVIVMRHASSPRQAPDASTAHPDNLTRERQLDETGRRAAAAMGSALRALEIPIGSVFSSPTFRAVETVRAGEFGTPTIAAELGDRGRSMQGVTEQDGSWLRGQVDQRPKGTNTILVTHLPNIRSAFPQLASGLADGDALIFGPVGTGGTMELVARIKINEWPALAAVPQR